ncbi:class I adenylate-forming enzyme family protein [Henriciella aquimarina]|uniref:class I adenylate-forming enzyme family protein n=1 Tax=Henriciella aquimarina TaxID=545261 RepID=UPI000A02F213|nr:AMP-binding protein [Henriciella aquimarina]
MDLRSKTLGELIISRAAETPDETAVTFVTVESDGSLASEARTCAELEANARRLAGWLRAAGIGQGDRIGIMLRNHPEFVETMIAASFLGALFVPVDPRSKGDKLAFMLHFTACKALILGDYASEALQMVAGQVPELGVILMVGDPGAAPEGHWSAAPYRIALESADPLDEIAEIDLESPMFMMFTSGTTGNPKAVVRTHASHQRDFTLLLELGIEPDYRLYTGLPLCHINAQFTLNLALRRPQPAVFSRTFTKTRLLDICRTFDCNTFSLLGGMIPEVFSNPVKSDDADNPVKLVISSGMPAGLWGAYRERYDVEITELYGSTEGGGALINCRSEGPIGSMGRPPQGMIAAILDETDTELPPGQAGHICFRPKHGDARPVDYYKNEKAGREKVEKGWFRSGDIAHMDAEGWFYFHHREGGGVRRNGDFVNTFMVESVLSKHPAVADVFVYGVQTEATIAGEKELVAAIVLEDGASLDAVKAWAPGELQKNEVPGIWQQLDAIPKTVSEKPIERACIELLTETGLVTPTP